MATWNPGEVILGDYVIERKLGHGGMGEVFLVKSQSTGRQFAVKKALVKDEKSRKMFLAELQAWIDLPEHPNILPCRFFRTVDEEIVIFTDYIAGGSLADWIVKRKLTTIEQILDVAIQFAWGLHGIHERGLIHQDVKPSNVLMTVDGVPMVTDFGLARARCRSVDGDFVSPALASGPHSVLVPGAGLMTPQYASPEQRAGQPLSRKTDIWSWGVSVLDMFMGGVSCPHGGHIAAEVLDSFLENGQMEDGLPEMPGGVADILRKCFAGDPAERWGRLDEPVKAMIDVVQSATSRKYERKLHHAAKRQREASQHDRRVRTGQRWRDPREWLRDAYDAVRCIPNEAESYQPSPAYSCKGAGVADLAIYEEAERLFLQAIESGRTDAHKSLAKLYFDKAILCSSLDDSMGTLRAYDQCLAIYKRLVEQEGRRELANDLALVLMFKAFAIYSMGDLAGAIEFYDHSIAIRRQLVEQEGRRELSADLAHVILSKAVVIYSIGNLAEAVALYDQGIAIYRRLVEQEGQRDLAHDLAGALMDKAVAISDMGDLTGAVVLYDQSISILRQAVDRDGRQEQANNLANALMNKATTIKTMGKLAEAISFYDECITIRKRLVEQEGRRELADDLAKVLMNKAFAVRDAGDLAGAITLYDQGIAIYRRLVEQEGRRDLANNLASGLNGKALTICSMGKPTEAVALYNECIAIRRRLVEQEGRRELTDDLGKVFMNKAIAVKALGDLQGAITLYDLCIAIFKRLVEQEGRQELADVLAKAILNKAITITDEGDLAEVITLYDQGLAIYTRLVEQDGRRELASDLALALMNKAFVIYSTDDLAGAVKLFDHCISIYGRLVEQDCRSDLAGDLARVQLLRVRLLLENGNVPPADITNAKKFIALLEIEVQRTGRSDLQRFLHWAQENFDGIL